MNMLALRLSISYCAQTVKKFAFRRYLYPKFKTGKISIPSRWNNYFDDIILHKVSLPKR